MGAELVGALVTSGASPIAERPVASPVEPDSSEDAFPNILRLYNKSKY